MLVGRQQKKFHFSRTHSWGAVDAKILKFSLIYDDWGAVDAVHVMGAAKKAPILRGSSQRVKYRRRKRLHSPNRAFLLVQVRMSTAPYPELV